MTERRGHWRSSLISRGSGELIHGTEVDIARDEDLDPIALCLLDGGTNPQRVAEHFLSDIARCGGIQGYGCVGAPILGRRLHESIDHGDENGVAKSQPPVPIDRTRQSAATEFI